MGLRVLKTSVRMSAANAICERVIETIRRECLDVVIPLTESHLYRLLKEWVTHYNEGRPHMSLGPGVPHPPASLPTPQQAHRHRLPAHQTVRSHPILSGVYHDYRPERKAA
jgi:putative transposase